jgi:hypothetical protein
VVSVSGGDVVSVSGDHTQKYHNHHNSATTSSTSTSKLANANSGGGNIIISGSKNNTDNSNTTSSTLRPETLAGLTQCQRLVRDRQARRRALRLLEFECWLHDCWWHRVALTALNALFLATLAALALLVCLLLSALFSQAESLRWVVAVCKSYATQVLLTNPLVSLGVLCVDLGMCSAVLVLRRRRAASRAKKKIRRKRRKRRTRKRNT